MRESDEGAYLYYYNIHPTEDDTLGQTSWHSETRSYIRWVLKWLFHDQICAICENLNFYQTSNPREYPADPDIAVVKGVAVRDLRSWQVGRTGPAPQVIIEVLAPETWRRDLYEQPTRYAQMGVQEYFAYDPHEPPLAPETAQRLFGWWLDDQSGLMHPLQARSDGDLWSAHLDSWLVPDGEQLRFYRQEPGQMRLTEAEAMRAARDVEARRADAEARRAEAMATRVRILSDKLRSLGIDPDQI